MRYLPDTPYSYSFKCYIQSSPNPHSHDKTLRPIVELRAAFMFELYSTLGNSRLPHREPSTAAMRGVFLSVLPLAGSFSLMCLIAGNEAFVVPHLPSFSVASWQTTSHLARTMQQQTCSSLLVQAAPHRSGSGSHYCGSQPYSLPASSTVPVPFSTRSRRSPSALGANTGQGGEGGSGTQQLSRETKLAISILIDLIGISSYALPGLGEVRGCRRAVEGRADWRMCRICCAP